MDVFSITSPTLKLLQVLQKRGWEQVLIHFRSLGISGISIVSIGLSSQCALLDTETLFLQHQVNLADIALIDIINPILWCPSLFFFADEKIFTIGVALTSCFVFGFSVN